jgi:hypothetical protein
MVRCGPLGFSRVPADDPELPMTWAFPGRCVSVVRVRRNSFLPGCDWRIGHPTLRREPVRLDWVALAASMPS